MTTCRTSRITRLLWTALFCAPVFAADSIPGTSELGKLDSGSVESGFQMPAPAQFVPGSPPPPPDRKKSQIAAKALGMAAASQQKIACLGMMQQALEMKNESNAALMMMMAQQMCAQADQQMAAAMKNDEGIKQISQNDIPKMAELKTTPATFGKDKIQEAQVPTITFNDDATKGSSTNNEIPVAPTVAIPDLNGEVFNKPKIADDPKAAPEKPAEEPERYKTLEGIGDKNLAKADGKIGTPGDLNGPGPSAAFSGLGLPAKGTSGDRGLASTDKGSSSAGGGEGGGGGSGRKSGRVITAGTDGGGGGSAEKSGGGLDMQALMEQMMGGPPAGGDGGGSIEFIQLNTQNKEEPPPNVFEYAAFRYHKLATEQGAIRRRKTTGIKVPARATVAAASKVWTEPDQKVDTVLPTAK